MAYYQKETKKEDATAPTKRSYKTNKRTKKAIGSKGFTAQRKNEEKYKKKIRAHMKGKLGNAIRMGSK